ncbi:MAG: C45 family autoproteolytic acyltransferase/hydrolase [Candidatus Thorarchaeota archaeon]
MQLERITGDYRSTGKRLGQIHKQAGHVLPKVSESKREFVIECSKAVENHAPELLIEMREAAKSAGWEFDSLLANALAYDYHGQCVVLAVSREETANGKPLFGRNHDWMMSILPYSTLLDSNPTGSMRSLQFIETPGLSAGGVNEAGLALGVTLVLRNTIKPQPGIAANVAARWILDHFATTEEAVDYLRETPHVSGYTTLIADADGTMARVEVSPDKVVVGEPEDGLILATTHYLCEEMHEFENLELEFEWTYERERRVRDWYQERRGKIGLKDVQDVLSSHENGVCCHWLEEGEDAGTTWSWAASLGTHKLQASLGPPCEGGYKKIGFD